MKLQLLADNRLSDPGKCETCKFSHSWLEHGTWDWDCSNKNFDKLPGLDENEIEWGSKQKCILWEPIEFSLCKKHNGWNPIDASCSGCEAEYINSLNEEEYGF